MHTYNRQWHSPPQTFTLNHDEVHVWRSSLRWPDAQIQQWKTLLSTDERERADRFYFEKDREAYIAARGVLRLLIGRYLAIEPTEIRFDYGPQGKPALTSSSEYPPLRFNLSHSGDIVLYGFTLQRTIGVDVEQIRTNLEYEQIATGFFSQYEQETLQSLPSSIKPAAFFTCWTRKEAYIKAVGKGLSLPLDQFDVTLILGEPAKLLETRGAPDEADRWSLEEIEIDAGYKAAVVVEGNDWQLRCHGVPPTGLPSST